jgi:hypothetical protein
MRPVETKVKAATATSAVAGFIIWVLQTYVFKAHPIDPTLESYIYLGVPAVFAFVGGWWAKHTNVPTQAPPTVTVARAGVGRPSSGLPAYRVESGEIPPQLGGTVTQTQPEQIPAELKEPAMEAGQPPSV